MESKKNDEIDKLWKDKIAIIDDMPEDSKQSEKSLTSSQDLIEINEE